ncbi:MAG: class I SAM-dependent methyltransferase [Proteobacteria bacterium]|nr:methyltransferase [Pseudomonadota bacterium]NOG59645.1 class I SAM-dependent methyltransferase [Pseudomonadota bacterium]
MKLIKLLLISLLFINIGTVSAADDFIEKAVAAEHRSAENKARDIYRHPAETLSFFGLQPELKVLEILPGRGWYTEILSTALSEKGQLTVASFGENHPNDYLRGVHNDFIKMLDASPEIYGKIKRVVFEDKGYLKEVADGSQDMVVTFRNTHNWIRYGGIEDAYRSFHRVLKKGGVLGVVQHRANRDDDAKASSQKGYVPESYLIRLAEDMGFELVAKSEVNANPEDTKDHPEGVWTLPPSYRLKDVDKEKYSAIGESDRMTLRFVKL